MIAAMLPDIHVNPSITPEQLHTFYQRNQICEAGFESLGFRSNTGMVMYCIDRRPYVQAATARPPVA
jgi:hypothetical protein